LEATNAAPEDSPQDASAEAPEESPKRSGSRRWLLITSIAIVTVTLVGAGGWLFYQNAQAKAAAERRAAVLTAAANADAALTRVFADLAASDAAWATVKKSQREESVGELVADSRATIDGALALTMQVRAEMSEVESTTISSAYLEACDDVISQLETKRALVKADANNAKVLVAVSKGDAALGKGVDAVERSIDQCNDSKFSAGQESAEKAESRFRAALVPYAAAAKRSKGYSQVDALPELARRGIAYAAAIEDNAALGMRGSIGTYNERRKKVNALGDRFYDALGSRYAEFMWTQVSGTSGTLAIYTRDAKETWQEAREAAKAEVEATTDGSAAAASK
jgi:flagellar basal body-associated protein FliL